MKWRQWKGLLPLILVVVALTACQSLLEKDEIQVRVVSEPDEARVLLDGVSVGRTPIQVTMEPGEHELQVSRRGYRTAKRQINVTEPEETQKEQFDLEPKPAQVTLVTQPVEGQIEVLEKGVTVQSGENLELDPGQYTAKSKHSGYQSQEKSFRLEPGEKRNVVISLGEGMTRLHVESRPSGAVVLREGKRLGETPMVAEISADTEQLTFRKEGYRSQQSQLELSPGEEDTLRVDLVEEPTGAPVTFQTSPAGAQVFVDGKEVGRSPAEVSQLPFGDHRLRAILQTDPVSRRVGEAEVSISEPQKRRISLSLSTQQKLFRGDWLPAEEAVEKAQELFREQRVPNPISLPVAIQPEDLRRLREVEDLPEALHSLMAVGDELRLQGPEQEWRIRKRSETVTALFRAEVGHFIKDEPLEDVEGYGLEAPDEKGDLLDMERSLRLIDVALALHRERAPNPLIDWRRSQLQESPLKLYRTPEDGPITLIVRGGSGVSVSPEGDRVDLPDGAVLHLPSAQEAISVQWEEAPDRIMAAPARVAHLEAEIPQESVAIAKHEKRNFRLKFPGTVRRIDRWTYSGASEDWETTTLQAETPTGQQMPLETVQVGPHAEAGHYRRLWLVHFESRQGVSQRQLGVSYGVGQDLADPESDLFLRR